MGEEEFERGSQAIRRIRLVLLYISIGLILFFARPTGISLAIGFPLLALGEGIRFWAAGHLLKTRELVTSGPYRYTRNPLYLGRFLIFTGLCLMVHIPFNGTWILLILGWALFFGDYFRRKEQVEPARLRKTHGEAFESYFRSVPAFFPSFRPYPEATHRRWSGDRLRRNREQWMVVGLLLITGFLIWRTFSLHQ